MLTDLYVMDKLDGQIHRIGDNQHDSFWVDNKGVVHYCNLQNSDGCSGVGRMERIAVMPFFHAAHIR